MALKDPQEVVRQELESQARERASRGLGAGHCRWWKVVPES